MYPTDEDLDRIKNWDISDGIEDLMDFCREKWNRDNGYTFSSCDWHWKPTQQTMVEGAIQWTFVTGGWSDNEAIISALRQNHAFWMEAWYSSARGGKHQFRQKETQVD